jgi:hypothetical protein
MKCIECGSEKEPHEMTVFRSVIVCAECTPDTEVVGTAGEECHHERTIGKGGSAYDRCRHCGKYLEPDDFNHRRTKPADHPDLMSELLLCPFCGGMPYRLVRDRDGSPVEVGCTNTVSPCRIAGLSFSWDEWNTRQAQHKLQAQSAAIIDEFVERVVRELETHFRAREVEPVATRIVRSVAEEMKGEKKSADA